MSAEPPTTSNAAVWRTSVRDLQFRRRRFVIAIIATALCFGLTLALDGLVNHVIAESSRIVGLFHADEWLVSSGGSGPFTTTRLAPQAAATASAGGGAPTRSSWLGRTSADVT